jgi:hypothetical protein
VGIRRSSAERGSRPRARAAADASARGRSAR